MKRARLALAAPIVLALSAAPAVASHVVPFIDNDYPNALTEARQKRLPIFVEAWAPW